MLFEDEFDDLAALAYRTAFRIVGTRAEAEEIAQETMSKALVRWRRVRRHARPWVCRVAANEAIGVVRKRNRSLGAIVSPRSLDEADALLRIDLQRLLAQLPKRQRDVVVLRYLADLSEADVAAALGISIGTVKAHAHRALRALRASAAPEPEPDLKAVFDV
jgi:RNA polymerase sigma factor (sigma-70 family)